MQFQNTPELEGPFMHTGHLIPFLEISKEVREDVLRQLEHPLNEGGTRKANDGYTPLSGNFLNISSFIKNIEEKYNSTLKGTYGDIAIVLFGSLLRGDFRFKDEDHIMKKSSDIDINLYLNNIDNEKQIDTSTLTKKVHEIILTELLRQGIIPHVKIDIIKQNGGVKFKGYLGDKEDSSSGDNNPFNNYTEVVFGGLAGKYKKTIGNGTNDTIY